MFALFLCRLFYTPGFRLDVASGPVNLTGFRQLCLCLLPASEAPAGFIAGGSLTYTLASDSCRSFLFLALFPYHFLFYRIFRTSAPPPRPLGKVVRVISPTPHFWGLTQNGSVGTARVPDQEIRWWQNRNRKPKGFFFSPYDGCNAYLLYEN